MTIPNKHEYCNETKPHVASVHQNKREVELIILQIAEQGGAKLERLKTANEGDIEGGSSAAGTVVELSTKSKM